MNIISLSQTPWIQKGRGSRQFLSEAFSRHCGVHYFWLEGFNNWTLSTEWGRPRMKGRNFCLYRPPNFIPRTPWRPGLEKIWNWIRLFSYRRALRNYWVGPRVLYIWHPAMLYFVGKMDEDLVCYHIYDNIVGFYDDKEVKKKIAAAEVELIDKADIIVAASRSLMNLHGVIDRAIHCPAGVSDFLIEQVQKNLSRPADIPIRGPIVGYCGALNRKFGAEIVLALAKERPDLSIVLVGSISVPTDRSNIFSKLFSMSNVFVLGPKPWEEIPAYLRCFDVALMSYFPTEWSVYCEVPLKAYEYLAAGKPVVGYGLQNLSDLGGLVKLAMSEGEFLHLVDEALEEKSEDLVLKRINEARRNSWDIRADTILQIIRGRLEI